MNPDLDSKHDWLAACKLLFPTKTDEERERFLEDCQIASNSHGVSETIARKALRS